jgi:hypothetical protein
VCVLQISSHKIMIIHMRNVGLSLIGFFFVVRSFKISKALTFTISRL